jgi:hypothetical protein
MGSGRPTDRFDLSQCQVVVIGHVLGRFVGLQPAHDVGDTDAAFGHRWLAAVQPGIDDDVHTPVLGKLDGTSSAVLVGDPGEVVTNDRPEDLLAAPYDDEPFDVS